jgi:ABC-type sugar transport system ATPase subunit
VYQPDGGEILMDRQPVKIANVADSQARLKKLPGK